MSSRSTTAMCWFVLLVWAGLMYADAIKPSFDPPIAIYPALMLVLGYATGFKVTKGGGE